MRPLHGNHARIAAQHLGKLSVPHIESIDARRTAPQQAIGEAAGRCADVEAGPALDSDAEGVQRRVELLAAA